MARLQVVYLAASGDRYPLEVACYAPFAKSPIETAIVINAGAGINKRLYEPFACWLADHGLAVYAYDYRGIGGSRGKTIRGLQATIEDWGSKDCAGVIAFARTMHPASKIHVFAHSIGSIVTGFARDSCNIERIVMLSPHTGYAGDYAPKARLAMFILWHLLSPIVSRVIGYFPGRALGLPEDLPLGIVRRWASRRSQRSLRDDVGLASFTHIQSCILALRPYDDPFATHAAFARVRAQFPACHFDEMLIPEDIFGSRTKVGHFGFFNPDSRPLWSLVLEWFTTAHCPYCP